MMGKTMENFIRDRNSEEEWKAGTTLPISTLSSPTPSNSCRRQRIPVLPYRLPGNITYPKARLYYNSDLSKINNQYKTEIGKKFFWNEKYKEDPNGSKGFEQNKVQYV